MLVKLDKVDPAIREQLANDLKAVIEHLDTLYADNQDCILPPDCPEWILEQWDLNLHDPVPNEVYDVMRDGDARKPGLKQLRPDDDLFARVSGSKRKAGRKTIKHNPPLSSLHKSNHEFYNVKLGKFLKWLGPVCSAVAHARKIQRGDLVEIKVGNLSPKEAEIFKKDNLPKEGCYPEGELEIEFKYDGILIALYYKAGKLVTAALCDQTGEAGEDVTENVRYISNIPQELNLPVTCRITGEIICKRADFAAIQRKLQKDGSALYANTRNFAGGSLRQDDPKVTGERRLFFIGHGIQNLKDPPYSTGMERAKWANKELGIRFSRVSTFSFDKLAHLESLVPDLEYDVDGAVVSVADLQLQEEMGRHGNRPTGEPKGKEAWKFAAEQATTVVADVVWQTGRTGILTPVANFPPVKLAGTMVRKATLNNLGFMIRKRIDTGAEIIIIKSGEIIPKAIGVTKPIKGDPQYPKKCPSCGGKTIVRHTPGNTPDEEMYAVFCPNKDACPAQSVNRNINFFKVLGIKGLGPSSIGPLVESGIVREYADWFTLDLLSLERCGFSRREALLALGGIHMVHKPDALDDVGLMNEIERASKKKTVPLAKFLAALGIPGAGKTTGGDLAAHFGTLSAVMKASEADLAAVDGVGDKTAASIKKFFEEYHDPILRLSKQLEPEAPKTGKLSGVVFCFTGGAPEGKEYWIEEVEKRGGIVKGSMSSRVNYLVVGDKPGDKVQQADKLGVKKISLQQLKGML